MRPLKKSHRTKKRYLLVRSRPISRESIDRAILDYIGVLGHSKADPRVVWSGIDSVILSINREMINEVRSSLILSLKDFEVVRVSSSVKNLKNSIK